MTAPAIIVEDGTIVAGANSFCTLQEMRDYGTARGLTLPSDDIALTVMSNLAIDFIVSREPFFAGGRTDPVNQQLPFPRIGVQLPNLAIIPYAYQTYVNGPVSYDYNYQNYYYDANYIPTPIKAAQSQLVCEQVKNPKLSLMPTISAFQVKSRKIGVQGIETVYDTSGAQIVQEFPAVAALLNLFAQLKTGIGAKTVRV